MLLRQRRAREIAASALSVRSTGKSQFLTTWPAFDAESEFTSSVFLFYLCLFASGEEQQPMMHVGSRQVIPQSAETSSFQIYTCTDACNGNWRVLSSFAFFFFFGVFSVVQFRFSWNLFNTRVKECPTTPKWESICSHNCGRNWKIPNHWRDIRKVINCTYLVLCRRAKWSWQAHFYMQTKPLFGHCELRTVCSNSPVFIFCFRRAWGTSKEQNFKQDLYAEQSCQQNIVCFSKVHQVKTQNANLMALWRHKANPTWHNAANHSCFPMVKHRCAANFSRWGERCVGCCCRQHHKNLLLATEIRA